MTFPLFLLVREAFCPFAHVLLALTFFATAPALAEEDAEQGHRKSGSPEAEDFGTSPPLSTETDSSAAEESGTLAPLTEVLTGESREAYDAARLLFADGDFRGASAKFHRAYELYPDPRLLWNAAACEKEQRNYARASQLIERYLEEGGARLAEQSRASAEETLAALRGFSSRVTLSGVPDGARIFADGAFVATAPLAAPLHLDLGQLVLQVEVSGHKPFVQELSIPGNTEIEVEVTLVPEEKKSQLSVVTTGAQDTIRIDGKVVGEGRFEGSLEPGAHRLSVTAQGKKTYEVDLFLAPGKARTLQVTLEDAKEKPLWPWLLAGGAVAVAGASVGGYFLFSDRGSDPEGPSGSLGTIELSLSRR